MGGVPKDSITGREIKNSILVHYNVAVGSGLSCSQMNTIEVHPSWKLHVD
jgi:hypothetical protein